MAEQLWYLEKNGKYYGPVGMSKLQKWAAAGTIGPQTRITADKRQQGKPISERPDIHHALVPFFEQGAKRPPSTPPKPAPSPKPLALVEQESYSVGFGNKTYGPYPLRQLKMFFDSGKLGEDAICRSTQTGGEQPLAALLKAKGLLQDPGKEMEKKDAPREPVAVPAAPLATESTRPPSTRRVVTTHVPPPNHRAPAPDPADEEPPYQSHVGEGFKRKKGIAVVLTALLMVVAMLWVYLAKSEDPPIELPKQFKPDSKVMRKVVKPLPPINDLAHQALREGLNFRYEEIKEIYKNTNLDYDRVADFQFAQYFPGNYHREVSYILNENYHIVFLFDDSDFVSAVAVTKVDFASTYLENYEPEQFHDRPKVLESPDKITWRADLPAGIVGELVWLPAGKKFALSHIGVYEGN